MFNKIKNMVTRCKVTKSGDDSGVYPINQSESLGVVQNYQIISIYGVNYNPHENADGLSFLVCGAAENKAAIFQGSKERIQKGLKPGEVAIGSPIGGNYIKFLNDGGIEIHGKSLKQVIDGSSEYESKSTSIKSPLNVDGEIHATGKIISDVDVMAVVISLLKHLHVSAEPGKDTSPPK